MREAAQTDSRRAVLVQLRMSGLMTTDALVEATGLSKTAVRAHLVRMERDGFIQRAIPEPDGPGRPPAAFVLTDAGAAMFPSDDDAVLGRLLRFLEDNEGGPLVKKFFEGVWSERMTALLAGLGVESLADVDLDARIGAVERALAEKNFMPQIDRRQDADGSEIVTVRECNCPFFAAAEASRTPCRLEVDFLARALGAKPRFLSIATNRTERCSFEFVVPAEGSK